MNAAMSGRGFPRGEKIHHPDSRSVGRRIAEDEAEAMSVREIGGGCI